MKFRVRAERHAETHAAVHDQNAEAGRISAIRKAFRPCNMVRAAAIAAAIAFPGGSSAAAGAQTPSACYPFTIVPQRGVHGVLVSYNGETYYNKTGTLEPVTGEPGCPAGTYTAGTQLYITLAPTFGWVDPVPGSVIFSGTETVKMANLGLAGDEWSGALDVVFTMRAGGMTEVPHMAEAKGINNFLFRNVPYLKWPLVGVAGFFGLMAVAGGVFVFFEGGNTPTGNSTIQNDTRQEWEKERDRNNAWVDKKGSTPETF